MTKLLQPPFLRMSVLARLLLPRRASRRRREQIQTIRSSPLFDERWYLETYPDVAAAGVDPVVHFFDIGWREGRDPGPEFVTEAYLEANADVARTGANPLLHFIEFGRSEGRATYGHRPLMHSRPAGTFDFGPPAPCASFALSDEPPPPWVAADRLDRDNPQLFACRSVPVGYAADASLETRLEEAFALLDLLSGCGEQRSFKSVGVRAATERLTDSWYVNPTQLRTRWTAETYPFVLRAFQYASESVRAPCLVGEGLVASPLDVVDFQLQNPFFPLLFAIAKPNGSLRGAMVLAFPSLCRGGVHYPELLWSAAQRTAHEAVDPLVESDTLAERLLRLVAGEASPAVRSIAVDLERADGTGPLFQEDCQAWLTRVAKVSVLPAAVPDCSVASQYLARAVTATAPDLRDEAGATLIIGADMVPTIAALTEAIGETGGDADELIAPLLSVGPGTSQVATYIEIPTHGLSIPQASPAAGIAKWPRLNPGGQGTAPAAFPAAAIRLSSRKNISEAEFFFPVGNDTLSTESDQRAPITWLITPQEWQSGQLDWALHSAALQEGASADAVAFIGSAEQLTISIARELFSGRLRLFPDIRSAVRALDTPLAGFLGPGVLLHDNRCLATFSSILEAETVATVSCVLISTERRGKASHSLIANAGALATPYGQAFVPISAFPLKQLWRTNYPVRLPSADLWVARSSRIAIWLNEQRPLERCEGVHICSSLVTASCVADKHGRYPEFVPQAPDEQVTKVEALYG